MSPRQRFLLIFAFVSMIVAGAILAHSQGPAHKISPKTGIEWGVTCTGDTPVYNTVTNQCQASGTAANPAGSPGQGQYNFGGAFGGSSHLTFDANGYPTLFGPNAQGKPLVAAGVNGIVGDGTTNDTAALQALADTAIAAGGGTIDIAPGTYKVCGLQLNGSLALRAYGSSGWGSPSGFVAGMPVILKCDSTTSPIIHVINSAGNTTLLHDGPTIENIGLQDSTNAGAGGSGVGGILIETTNRGIARKISCSNFSAAFAYCVKISQPASSLYDASYWIIEQPFVRNTDIGIDSESYADGTLIMGGEVVGNRYGLYAPHTAVNSTHLFNYGTSYECIAVNATCVYLGGIGAQVNARYEGNSTTSIGVHLDSNSGHNVVGGTFNDLKVGIFNEGSSNSLDTSDVSTVKTYVIDRGFATRWAQAGIGNYEQDNPANAYDANSNTFHGLMYGPTGVSGVNMQFELGSRNGYLLKGAPGNFYEIGDGAITVASGSATITFPSTQQFAAGDVLNINSTRSAAGVGPSSAACTGVAVVDTTHVTCTTSLADGTYSNGWIWGISGLWRGSMHAGHVYGECQGAMLLNDAGNSATALDTNAVCVLHNPNGFTARTQIYVNTGLTVGSTFTPTLMMELTGTIVRFPYLNVAGVVTNASTGSLGTKPLAGSGTAVPTGPNSGTANNDLVCYNGTTGSQKDCGPIISNVQVTTGTSTINANTCTTDFGPLTMAGTATTSTVNFTPSTDTSAITGWGSIGGLTIVPWPAANAVHYKVCNQTGSNITPGSVTWNVSAR